MQYLISFLFLVLCPRLLLAAPVIFPALSGASDARTLVVYSSLDEPLAKPMILGFQKANPDVAVRYEDMLTGRSTTVLSRKPTRG